MAKSLKKSLKKSLLENKAEENTQVTKGTSKEQEVIKKGVPNDPSRKKDSVSTVGVSIGLTLNMGDYESLRVDTWLTDTVKDNETQEAAYERVTKVVSETLERVVSIYK